MATIYLRSTDGNDADNGSTWALAKATLAAALTAAGDGGTVYVSHQHSETQATAMTLTSPGTAATPVKIVCVNDGAEPPTTLATSARVSTTDTGAMVFAGFAYAYGVSFQNGVGQTTGSAAGFNFVSTTPWCWTFEQCHLVMGNTVTSSRVLVGAGSTSQDDQLLVLKDSSLVFNNASHKLQLRCSMQWNGNFPSETAFSSSGTTPTVAFTPVAGASEGTIKCRGLDLSNLGTGCSLVNIGVGVRQSYKLSNCKLGASVAMSTGTAASIGGVEVEAYNCDSADTNYMLAYCGYLGTIDTVTGQYLSGGSTIDSQAIALKGVSSAGTTFTQPLTIPVSPIYVDTVGSAKTVTVEIAQDSAAAALTESEIWLEVEYLGTSGYPISSVATDHNSTILSLSSTAQTTSTATWTGLTNPTKQKLAVTFTPQEKGYIQCRVCLAKASTTVYVDQLPVVA